MIRFEEPKSKEEMDKLRELWQLKEELKVAEKKKKKKKEVKNGGRKKGAVKA